MCWGLVVDDRSREEGRHYTYQCVARLHSCGASDETDPSFIWPFGQILVGASLLTMPGDAVC